MPAMFLLLAVAILAVATMVLLSALMPGAGLSGLPRLGSLPDGPFRAWLEVTYFAANIALPVTAVLALLFARRQANNARRQNDIAANAERAGSYLMLFREERPKIMAGVETCLDIRARFEALPEAERRAMRLADFARRHLAALREAMRDGDPTYREILALLTTLENLGLLVDRDYVAFEDLHALLEGPLDFIAVVVLGHAEERRAASPDGRELEYTVALLRRVARHEPCRSPLQRRVSA